MCGLRRTEPDRGHHSDSDVHAATHDHPNRDGDLHPATPPGPKTTIDSDGTYQVGVDIAPGNYRTAGSSGCYWARPSGLDTSDIIDNNNSNGPQVVSIQPTDKAFLTQRCGTWQKTD